LISLIIKIFKKYSLFRRLWSIINTIIISIFGISLIDNFGFEFIKNFLWEIRVITYSIITYLINTQFYSFVASLFSSEEKVTNPTKVSHKDGSVMRETNWETKDNEKSNGEGERNSRISEWLKPEPEPEIKEEVPEYNFKKIIIWGIIIGATSCLTYYYWDEITPHISSIPAYASSVWEWVKRRRGGNNDGGNENINPQDRYNRIVDNLGLNRNKKQFSIQDKGKLKAIAPDDNKIAGSSKLTDDGKPVELINNSSHLVHLIDPVTGKEFDVKSPVLTSPSLDDLNSQVTKSWNEVSSPSSSTSSTATLKPINLPDTTHESFSQSLDSFVTSGDDPLQDISSLFNSSSGGFINPQKLKLFDKITSDNWKDSITENTLNSMEIVENFFNDSKPKLTDTTEMTNKFVDILQTYDWMVNYYLKHPDLSEKKKTQFTKSQKSSSENLEFRILNLEFRI